MVRLRRDCWRIERRGSSRRSLPAKIALLLAVVASSLLPFSTSALASDSDPILKMDVPKFDLTIPKSDKTLKGGVQHMEQGQRNNLSGDASKNTIEGKAKKKHDLPRFLFGFGRNDNNKPLKSNLRNDNLTSQVESGIGIIGVKFVLGFGRPPIINRVFPGTPAYISGLRVDDIIVAVDGIPTSGLSKDEVYNMIVGTPNTPVTVSVARKGDFIARTMNRMDFNDIADPQVKRDYLLNM